VTFLKNAGGDSWHPALSRMLFEGLLEVTFITCSSVLGVYPLIIGFSVCV